VLTNSPVADGRRANGSDDRSHYFPFATALYFNPKTDECSASNYGPVACSGGEYYLNIRAIQSGGEIQASAGTESGRDASTDPSLGDQVMNELGKAAAEKRKRREKMQAEEAVQEDAGDGASVKQNVCLSFAYRMTGGLFHTFDGDERPGYVASLATLTERDGTRFVSCFSDDGPDTGPHPISQEELRAAFTPSHGWKCRRHRTGPDPDEIPR
jgi:hypothetical protein